MEPSQRLDELLMGCKATLDEEVTVNVTHLMEVGMTAKEIDEMSNFIVETTEVVAKPNSRSTRKSGETVSGMAGMPRVELVKKLEELKASKKAKPAETKQAPKA